MVPRSHQVGFEGSISNRRARVTAIIAGAGLAAMIGLAWVSALNGGRIPTSVPPHAAAATLGATDARTPDLPSAHPKEPSPAPTLTPFAAPALARDLEPTDVLVAASGERQVGALVPDADGTVWTTRADAIVNIDPRTGRTREWTLADDQAFMSAWPVISRSGGVWLVSRDAIRLFDGERFRAVIATPSPVWNVLEGSDGAIWATSDEFGLIRWVDGIWSSAPPGRPVAGAAGVVLAADGRMWTVDWPSSPAEDLILRGISAWATQCQCWETYIYDDLPRFLHGQAPALFAAPDASIWASYDYRLAHFEGGRWAAVTIPGIAPGLVLKGIDDGGRMVFAADGSQGCDVRIQIVDGSSVTSFGPSDGLPGPDADGQCWAEVVPVSGGVLVSTAAGLYRLKDGRWGPLAPSPARPPEAPGWIISVVALSRDEAWVVAQSPAGQEPSHNGLYRFGGSTWHEESMPAGVQYPERLAAAPGPGLWALAEDGPLARRDGRWINLGDVLAETELATDCGGAIAFGLDGSVAYVGAWSGRGVVTLQPSGSSWTAATTMGLSYGWSCPQSAALTGDGGIWVLDGWGRQGTLWRQDGDRWVRDAAMLPTELPGMADPAAMAVDGEGSLVVLRRLRRDDLQHDAGWDVVQRVGGQWLRRGPILPVSWASQVAVLPDGSLLVVGDELVRLDGNRWTSWLPSGAPASVSVAPDGAVWAAGGRLYRLTERLP